MTELKTFFFELIYENGLVRQIKSGNTEIIRMIYSAVRDHNWGTIEPEIITEKIAENAKSFQIKTLVKYQKADIHFEAEYTITGNENRLTFEMEGEAKSTFKTNRVGFCVLHPIKECTGKTCTVIHPDKTSEKAVFPQQISPDQPMKNISSLEWEPAENIGLKLHFSGNIFEMEDQRNWTDASYKTYCRPLSLPFPFELEKGEKIWQKIELEIRGELKSELVNETVLFSINRILRFKIPEIGVGATSRNEPLEKPEAEILKQIPIHHLRAELKFFEKNFNRNLNRMCNESRLLGIPLFLVLYFSENFKTELTSFQKAIKIEKVAVKYILVVGKNHLSNDIILNEIYADLKVLFPNAKIGTGVNAYFAELNRNRPQTEKAEFVSFAVCPQVHAFDDVSLVENLEAQKYVIESAKNLFPEKPVFVSPVTLKQRFNVVATSEGPDTEPGELPPQVDNRQNSAFAAQWLLGSLKNLAQSGTDLVTYFETVGWRGFIQGIFEPPVPEKFNSKKGDSFPVFSLLNEIAGFNEVVFSESSSPIELDGIVLAGKDFNGQPVMKLILANFSNQPKKVKVSGIDTAPEGNYLFTLNQIKKENGLFEIAENQIVVIPVS